MIGVETTGYGIVKVRNKSNTSVTMATKTVITDAALSTSLAS